MTGFTIRDARWPDDEAAAISFIDALQKYEREFEPNRRIDAQVGADYFEVLRSASRSMKAASLLPSKMQSRSAGRCS